MRNNDQIMRNNDKVTTQCVVKTVSTVGKISKTTNEFPLDRIGKLAISRYSP